MIKKITKLFAMTVLSLFVTGSVNVFGQGQIIGSFPNMQGGFENQTAGSLTSALSSTVWNGKASTAGGSLVSGTARTGSKYISVASGTATGKYYVSPNGNATTATAYTIQYFYRIAGSTASAASYGFGVNVDGTGTLGATAAQSLPATSGAWSAKQTISYTPTGTSASPYGYAGFKTTGAATTVVLDIDDFVIYAGAADAVAPDAPTAPVVTTSVATQMSISWAAPATGVDGGGYVVVRSAVADPTAVPNANGIYAVGSTVSDGSGVSGTVVYIGTNTSFTDLSLTASTHYYYRIYAVDKAFNYSSALAGDFTTTAPNFVTEPTTQVSTIAFANVASTSMDINWTAGSGTNSLVVVKSGSAGSTDPVDGDTYTPNTLFGSGSVVGTGNYVVYNGTGNSVTITGLTKATNYYVKVYTFSGSAGTENYLTTLPASAIQLSAPGEIVSTGSNSAGVAWATASAWVGGVVPAAGDNVTIAAGDKIQVAASANCYNLTVQSGGKLYNTTALPTSSLVYLTVYGNSITCNGTLGDKTADAATTDCALGINFVGNLTINGTGTIRPARIRPNGSSTNVALTVNANMEMTYAGSAGAGGAAIYADNSSNDNIVLNVNSGKVLSFVDFAGLGTTASSTANSGAAMTININGTVTLPANSSLSLFTLSTKTATLNVNGTLNVGKLNATSFSASGTGGAPVVNIGSAGVINVNTSADFSSPTLSAIVTGTGAFNLNTGASMSIGAATGLEPVAGAIRTTTRNFSTGSNYSFTGTSAQTIGSDFPTTVNNLTVNNATGASLTNSITVNGTLTLTAGALSLGANNLTVAPAGSLVGGSATAFIVTDGVGKLTQNVAAGAAKLFPIGTSTTSYDPVSLTPTDATAVTAAVGITLPASVPASYTYSAKVWSITPTTPSSTSITLTPSAAVTTALTDVIAYYTGENYVNTVATKVENAYTATFSTFFPFVTGTTDLGTALAQPTITGVTFDGQIIHNASNQYLQVFDVAGRKVTTSNKDINMVANMKGVYFVKSNTGMLKILLNN